MKSIDIQRETILQVLEEIDNELDKTVSSCAGLYLGHAGVSLFYGYYYCLKKDEKHKIKSLNYLERSIKSYSAIKTVDISRGITGINLLILYLAKLGILEEEESGNLRKPFERFITDKFDSILSSHSYDFIKGYLGVGHYLLEMKNISLLGKILDRIDADKNQYKNASFLPFLFPKGSDGSDNISLGLAHGIPSVIHFISECAVLPELQLKASKLIDSFMELLEHNKCDEQSISIWPSVINTLGKQSINSRLGWCYGDLGIGLSYLNAGITFKKSQWINVAKEIFIKSTSRLDKNQNELYDAQFCHGTLGVAHIFNKMRHHFDDQRIASCYEYWKVASLEILKQSNPKYFQSYYKSEIGWKTEPGILEGISGMGLVLISMLNVNLSSWDRLFQFPLSKIKNDY